MSLSHLWLKLRSCFIPLLFLMLFSGCNEKKEAKPIIPSIKVFTVGKTATGQARRISGTVQAADTSELSFGVGGQILEILVEEGEVVTQGQLIARLDDEPLKIKLEEARARLSSARAKLVEAEATLDRTQRLFESKGASKKELDSAEANLAADQATVDSSKGRLSQAQLDYNRTKLTAPFPGKVQKKMVESFKEVTAAEKIITLQSSNALEIEVRVPETMIKHVDYSQLVSASFPSLPDVNVQGTITVIAAEAEDGNAYPVTVSLSKSDADIRPGMTASVTFNYDEYLEGRTAYLIPISAIAIDAGQMQPGKYAGKKHAPVFVFDEATQTIKERGVKIGQLRDNELEVFEGLEEGEKVVSAGVPFVTEGMKAKIWVPMNKVSTLPTAEIRARQIKAAIAEVKELEKKQAETTDSTTSTKTDEGA